MKKSQKLSLSILTLAATAVLSTPFLNTPTAATYKKSPKPHPAPTACYNSRIIREGYLNDEDCSTLIIGSGLVPRVYHESTSLETRLIGALNYLVNAKKAFEENPEYDLTFSDYGINKSYPIAIPDDYKLSDLIGSFLKEVDSGKTTFRYDETYEARMGMIGGFHYKDGTISRPGSKIILGSEIMDHQLYKTGSYNYQGWTDADTAHMLIHEYAHALQDDAINEKVTELVQKTEIEIPEDPIEIIESAQESKEEYIKDTMITLDLEYARTNGISASEESLPQFQYNEVQANECMFTFVYALEQMNDSKDIGIGTKNESLYRCFKKYIIKEHMPYTSTFTSYHPMPIKKE